MDWNFFILGMCSMAIFFNLKDFFNDDVGEGSLVFNTIILVIILLISIGRIIKT